MALAYPRSSRPAVTHRSPLTTMTSSTGMAYVRLGNSGLKVSKIILGCMSYGNGPGAWFPWCLGEEEGIQHIKAAYDAGVNAFDTGNCYSNGESEVILGKAIKQHNLPRDRIVVLSKVWGTVSPEPGAGSKYWNPQVAHEAGYVNQRGLSRKHIMDSVKASLKRLDLEYLDVLQCHRFDEETPISETMHALHDLVKAGLVRYIGMCSCYAWQFHIMQNYAISNNLTPFISMQNQYSLIYREEEREMIPTLKYLGASAIPWATLGRGMLARPLDEVDATKRAETEWMIAGFMKYDCNITIVKRVEEVAAKKNISMAQVALAWCINKPGVAAAVVGTTSLKNLTEVLGSVNVSLSDEEVKYLEEPYTAQAFYMD